MKLIFTLSLLLATFISNGQTYNGPESAEFDVVNNRWLIGNTGSHQVLAKDSLGALTIFAQGLGSGPYGIEIVGDTLFCCCGSSIKGYLLSSGAQVFNVNVGASFLNGLAHDNSSNLYATDFSSKTIIRLNIATQVDSVVASGLTQTPNGIIFDEANNRCVYVTWGSNAPVKAIDLSTYAVSTVVTTTLGSCDGIARDGEGRYYVSSWGSQSIYRFDSAFAAPPVVVGTGMSSPADIYYDAVHDVLAVPNSGNNTVTFLDFNTSIIVCIGTGNISNVYPNPANSNVTVEFTDENYSSVEVFNSAGQIVNKIGYTKTGNNFVINVSALARGNYYFILNSENGKTARGNFVVGE